MKRCVGCFIPPGFFVINDHCFATDMSSLRDFLSLMIIVLLPRFYADFVD